VVDQVDARLHRDEEKRRRAQQKKLEREEAEILQTLDRLDMEKRVLDESFANPEVYTDGLKVKEIREKALANEAEQKRLQERWEAVTEELGSLEKVSTL
jgi:hypothetical protein